MSYTDEHFRHFASQLETAIEKYGGIDEIVLVERQKRQVETLVKLEKRFRKILVEHRWGPGVYASFIKLITQDKKNILAARPYFRERQDVFTSKIAKILKKENAKQLTKFHFNYQFVKFALDLRKWPENSELRKIGAEIERLRTEIVEMNMPLAISRARIFWSKTPRSHLSYMDLVQISCEGLMSAVDKFVLPYSKVFRAVAIGRIIGELIENYSETTIHFYPQDKRKLYRANKRISKYGENPDYEALAKEINEGVEEYTQKTDADEISGLLLAASHVSTDVPLSDNTSGVTVQRHLEDRCMADPSQQPDNSLEELEATKKMRENYSVLSFIERKVLRMKGISVDAII